MQGGGYEPLAGGRDQALGRLVDILDGFAERRDDGLVGAELDDLAELLLRGALDLVHLLDALIQRVVGLRDQ